MPGARVDQSRATQDLMGSADRRPARLWFGIAQVIADLVGTPIGVLEAYRDDSLTNRIRSPMRAAPRCPGSIGQPGPALLMQPAQQLVSGLARDPVLQTQSAHRGLAYHDTLLILTDET